LAHIESLQNGDGKTGSLDALIVMGNISFQIFFCKLLDKRTEKGYFAILDRGIFCGSNSLVAILLASWYLFWTQYFGEREISLTSE